MRERPPIESGAVRKPEVNFLKAFRENLLRPKIQSAIPAAVEFDERLEEYGHKKCNVTITWGERNNLSHNRSNHVQGNRAKPRFE